MAGARASETSAGVGRLAPRRLKVSRRAVRSAARLAEASIGGELLADRVPRPDAIEQQSRVAENPRQEVVEVVRQRAGQTGDAFHPLGFAHQAVRRVEGALLGVEVLGQREDVLAQRLDLERPARSRRRGRLARRQRPHERGDLEHRARQDRPHPDEEQQAHRHDAEGRCEPRFRMPDEISRRRCCWSIFM
jgi:hypothetical protein